MTTSSRTSICFRATKSWSPDGCRHAAAALAAALAFLSAERQSPAQSATSLHGTGDLTVAVDTNVSSEGAQSVDGAFTVSPGLLLLHRLPRGGLAASWTRSFVFFVVNDTSSASTDSGRLDFNYQLSELDTIGLSAGLDRTRTNLISLNSPSSTTAAAQPSSPVQLLTPTLSERYDRRLSDRWSIAQTAGGSVTLPLSDDEGTATLATATASLGPTVSFEQHDLTPAATFAYYYLSRTPLTITLIQAGVDLEDLDEPVHQFFPGGELTWGWRFADEWESRATGGVQVPINLEGDTDIFPVGRLAALWQRGMHGASLVLSRAMNPSFQTQQVFLTHAATLSGFLPIVEEENVFAEGATSVAHNDIYAVDEALGGARATSLTIDMSVAWTPIGWPTTFRARYQYNRQFATNDPVLLQRFERHTGLLGASFILPSPDPVLARRNAFEPADAQTPGGRPIEGENASGPSAAP